MHICFDIIENLYIKPYSCTMLRPPGTLASASTAHISVALNLASMRPGVRVFKGFHGM